MDNFKKMDKTFNITPTEVKKSEVVEVEKTIPDRLSKSDIEKVLKVAGVI